MSDDDVLVRYAELVAQLDASDDKLDELPIFPVEPGALGIAGLGMEATAMVPRLMETIRFLGRVIEAQAPAPWAVVHKVTYKSRTSYCQSSMKYPENASHECRVFLCT
jgi:hypothetical protein